jgi:hypothetical protein
MACVVRPCLFSNLAQTGEKRNLVRWLSEVTNLVWKASGFIPNEARNLALVCGEGNHNDIPRYARNESEGLGMTIQSAT